MLGFNMELKNTPTQEQVSIPLTGIFAPFQQEVRRRVIFPIPSRAKNDQKTVGIESQNRRVNGTTKTAVTSNPTPTFSHLPFNSGTSFPLTSFQQVA